MGIDKHYSDIVGLDTRSNKLVPNQKSARRGSKNFRYTPQDELTNANGFQHKSADLPSISVGDMEYRFRDPNTGEEKTEILAVCQNGRMYKKVANYIKFSNLGTATSYSYYYDETGTPNFKLVLGTYAAIVVSQAMTMDELRIAINALGATCTVVDDDDTTVTGSTRLAYLMDVIINKDLETDTITEMSSWFWEEVDFPSKGSGLNEVLPFPTTVEFYNDPDYEGISYQNLNNVVYITDGGFPMKYDGRSVYRAGMPKMLIPNSEVENFSGIGLAGVSATPNIGGLTPAQKYKYVFQYGFVDFQGSTIMGDYGIGTSPISSTYAGGTQPIVLDYVNYTPGNVNQMIYTNPMNISGFNFPIISATVDGNQNIPTGGGTITVLLGHNFKVGMLVRIPISNQSTPSSLAPKTGYSILMSRVSAVTGTTITLESGYTGGIFGYRRGQYTLSGSAVSASDVLTVSSTAGILPGDSVIGPGTGGGPFTPVSVLQILSPTTIKVSIASAATIAGSYTFNTALSDLLIDTQILNGGYAIDEFANQITNINYTNYWNPEIKVGAFVRVYRTIGDQDVFYKAWDIPIDWIKNSGNQSVIIDILSDFSPERGLSRIALDDSEQGSDLPRACKYLSTWQNQLVQSGRTVDPSLAEDRYPSSYYAAPTNDWGFVDNSFLGYKYTESHLCDFQSIYWNDVLTPEGFPQSGLFEELIDTPNADRVKGMGENKDAFFVFKDESTVVLTGTLATQELVQEVLEDNAGLVNHRTVQSVEGSLVWLDKVNGFYSCIAGRLPINIGYYIADEFSANPDTIDSTKSFAQTFNNQTLYMCVIDTKIFVYDFAKTSNNSIRGSWYMWNPFTAKSMIASSQGYLILSDGLKHWKMKTTGTKYDKSNHTTGIAFDYLSAWLNYNLPTIDKHFLEVWVNSIQGGFDLLVSQFGNYLDAVLGDMTITMPLPADKKTVKENMKVTYPKLSATSIGFSNSAVNADVIIQGWELKLEEDFDKGDPKR